MNSKLKKAKLKTHNFIKETSKKIILPGFNGLSLFYVGRFFIKGLKEGYITMRASSVAYNIFISIFPALIFLFSLIPFIPLKDFHIELFSLLAEVLPGNAYDLLYDTITDTIMTQRSSILSLGFFLMLFFASNGILSLISAFNASYHSLETRSYAAIRVLSIIMVIVISTLFITAISLLIIGDDFFVRLLVTHPEWSDNTGLTVIIRIIRWILVIILYFLAIAILYYYAPAKKSRFNFFSPGAIFATLIQIPSLYGFSYYVNNFSQYNKLYGSIGTIIVVMTLIYVISLTLILGFELNASILSGKENLKNNKLL